MICREKLCECGCGEVTGIRKGQPLRFIQRHHLGGLRENSLHWKGGVVMRGGYRAVLEPTHHRANTQGYVREHILIAESVLGRPLVQPHEVHHFNEDKSDNRNENLVICENRAYHFLLHTRAIAFRESGHAEWRRCQLCLKHDAISELYICKRTVYHRVCLRKP